MSRMGPRDPGTVALVPRLSIDHLLWVANTRHGPAGHWYARVRQDTGDHDHLADPRDAADYLSRHGVPIPAQPPDPAHLAALRTVRDTVRGFLDPAAPAWPPDATALLAATRFVAGPDGGIRADAEGWDALIGDLVLPLVQLGARRAHLRACGNPLCRLVFLDLSKNGSRRWCDTGGCGNRDRVRRYRAGGPAARSSGPRTDERPHDAAMHPDSSGRSGRTMTW